VKVAGHDFNPGVGDADQGAFKVGIGESDSFQHGASRCTARSVEQIVAFVSRVDGHGNSFSYGNGKLSFSIERVQMDRETFA
jgi:hypothetical protein